MVREVGIGVPTSRYSFHFTAIVNHYSATDGWPPAVAYRVKVRWVAGGGYVDHASPNSERWRCAFDLLHAGDSHSLSRLRLARPVSSSSSLISP